MILPYSRFCTCSRIFSNSDFTSTTNFEMSKLFAFEPIVLISRLVSCNKKSSFLPFAAVSRIIRLNSSKWESSRVNSSSTHSLSAKIAVSGYDHPLMNELFPSSKWKKTVGTEKTIHSTKGSRTEILWTNYNPKKQKELF